MAQIVVVTIVSISIPVIIERTIVTRIMHSFAIVRFIDIVSAAFKSRGNHCMTAPARIWPT